MKKKVISIISALAVGAMALAGCGSAAPKEESPAPEAESAAPAQESSTAAEESGEAAESAAEETAIESLDENVTIYVTVAPGGGLDVRARAIAPFLAERLGVDVTVENVDGGGGVICATQYVSQKKGKYDILMAPASVFTSARISNEVSYSFEDVTPLGSVDYEQFGLYVCPDQSGLSTMEDVIEYAKDNKVIFGSGGVGNVTFTMQDVLYKTLGFDAETLTHKNAPEGLTNCMGGHNVITMAGIEVARSYVESGDVVPVLTFSDTDYTGYEGFTVPSITKYENCAGYVYGGLQFMCVDSSLPADVIAFMQEAFTGAVSEQECISALADIGLKEVYTITPDEICDRINKEYDMLKEIM